jgi:Flp pilus assembly protein TadD
MRARVVLTVLLLSASLWAQKNTARTAVPTRASQIAQAESAMDREQWPEAEAILRKLVAANPKDALAWFDLGYVMHAVGNYPEAIAAYRGAVAAQPESFECNLNLGMILAHEKKPEAAQVLLKATQLQPTGEHPRQSLARAWAALAELRSADAKAALAAWAKAAELDASTQNLLAYGDALESSGDASGAETQFRRAADAEPQSPQPQAALANLYVRGKRLPEAELALRKVLAAKPQDENAHLQLGRVFSAEKKDEDATAELQKALALRPDDWDAVRELAFIAERGKHWAEAEKQYRALTLRFPADAEARNGLGSALLGELSYAEARDEFLRCLKLKPEWGEAYGQLALAAAGNKEYELAIKSLDERKKWLPESASSYFLRATSYDHLRLYKVAAENYKAFLKASNGQFPDDEWKARHRLIAIDPEARKK